MPLVRITLSEKHQEQTIHEISMAVHTSLMQEFNVPQDDFFQIIEALKKEHLKYSKSYLGIPHTEDLVFIQITAAAGRTIEQKKRLYHQISHRIATSTTIQSSDVFIVLIENTGKENWSFGNGEIQAMNHIRQ